MILSFICKFVRINWSGITHKYRFLFNIFKISFSCGVVWRWCLGSFMQRRELQLFNFAVVFHTDRKIINKLTNAFNFAERSVFKGRMQLSADLCTLFPANVCFLFSFFLSLSFFLFCLFKNKFKKIQIFKKKFYE